MKKKHSVMCHSGVTIQYVLDTAMCLYNSHFISFLSLNLPLNLQENNVRLYNEVVKVGFP